MCSHSNSIVGSSFACSGLHEHHLFLDLEITHCCSAFCVERIVLCVCICSCVCVCVRVCVRVCVCMYERAHEDGRVAASD